jgi:CubicO group peptidase (beta-lactamase class C family)
MNFRIKLILIALTICAGCNKGQDLSPYDYTYSIPDEFDDGIKTASLKSVGMDDAPIREMMDHINSYDRHRIHNILIFRKNKLVFEEYFQGNAINWNVSSLDGEIMEYTRETDHYMASVTKSVTSVITGAAIQLGYLKDLNKKIIDYFPEYAGILTGKKADITVEHLLTMRCGLAFEESTYPYTDPRNDVYKMLNTDDPIRFVLSKPIANSPGTRFFYNTGTTNVLATIIEKESGMSFLNFSNRYLFDALGIKGGKWIVMDNGLPMASGGLSLRARELSKIGLLFLNDGMWDGRQIISKKWINDSQQDIVNTNNGFFPNSSYGYQWWVTRFKVNGEFYKCFFAAGWGDQFMFIIPGLELIAEFNCGNYMVSPQVSMIDLLESYILKAITKN